MADEPHTDIDATFENLQFEELQFEELQLEEPQFEDGHAVDEQPTEPQPVAADQLVDEEEMGVSDGHAWEEVASDQHAEDAAGRLER